MTEFKLVPVVPTEAMINAGAEYGNEMYPITSALQVWGAMVKASPAHDGEVVYQQRAFGNRYETWRDIPKHEYDQLVLPSNGRILHTAPPRVVDLQPIESALKAMKFESEKSKEGAILISPSSIDSIIEALQSPPRLVDVVREAAERVVKAFEALGDERDQVATILRHRECEASMTALKAALEQK